MRREWKKRVKGGGAYLFLGLYAAVTLYPFLWLFLNSFKSTQEFRVNALGLPQKWIVVNYVQAWEIGEFGHLFINSFFYTATATLLVILLSMAASFGFAKLDGRFKSLFYGSFIIGILVTLQSILIPLFLMINFIGLYDTRLGVLIPYVGISLPFAVYLGTNYIKGVPNGLIEAARVEGCGYGRIYWTMILPLAKPVVVTLSILNVIAHWNEFILVYILTSSQRVKSLPVGIMRFSGTLASDYGKQFAALVIGILPLLIYYLLFHKQLTRGYAVGSVKG